MNDKAESDVTCSIEIRMKTKTTGAREIMPVASTQLTTAATSFGGVPGVNLSYRDAQCGGLVLDKLPELAECPRVKVGPIFLVPLAIFPDTCQPLQDNDRPVVLSCKLYDFLAHHMVGVFLKAGFSARQTFQNAFCAFRSFGLKTLSRSPVVMFTMARPAASIEDSLIVRTGGDGQIILAHIHTDDGMGLIGEAISDLGNQHHIEVESAAPFVQGSRPGVPIAEEILALEITAQETNFLPFLNRANRNQVLFRDKAKLATSCAALKRNAALEIKDCLAGSVSVRLHRRIGGGHLALNGASHLGEKTKSGSRFAINFVVQSCDIFAIAHLMGYLANIVQCIAVGLHRALQGFGLFLGWVQFEADGAGNFCHSIYSIARNYVPVKL